MYKMLFITTDFEPFISAWGAVAIPQPYENGWIMPIGWEEELSQRGIEFTEIEIPMETNE